MTETPQELIARLMQHVEDTMVEASVDYPAGHESGASISYDSDFLQKCFETELAASLAREAVLRGLANELSWSPKTRAISEKINAALAQSGHANLTSITRIE